MTIYFFAYTETNQNKPKLIRKNPNPPKKVPKETRFSIFSPPKRLICCGSILITDEYRKGYSYAK
jgi:hypothetical protein